MMTFRELAQEYYKAVESLNAQIEKRVKRCDELYTKPGNSREKTRLEREISILRDMRDEALSNAYYLDNYYRKDDEYAGKS